MTHSVERFTISPSHVISGIRGTPHDSRWKRYGARDSRNEINGFGIVGASHVPGTVNLLPMVL